MSKRFMLLFAAISIAVASAAGNLTVNLYQTTTVGGKQFKPGDAKVELKENKATLKQGKVSAEANVKIENATNKYMYTTVGYREGTDHQIKEICIGGTTTRIVFE